MFTHYLKIAVRNLRKYKKQSVISILGLAIGFTCLVLSVFWTDYERSYDNFHPKADRLYRVRVVDKSRESGFTPITPYPLAAFLKNTFPEIKDACVIQNSGVFIEVDGKPEVFGVIRTDASFPEMFDLPQSLQSFVFLPPYSAENERINPTVLETAITRKAARKLFGTEDVVGKEIKTLNKQTLSIRFVVNEWPIIPTPRLILFIPIRVIPIGTLLLFSPIFY